MTTGSAPPPPPADPGVGLRCPRCGCQDLRVSYTRHRPGRTVRARICRHCGRRVVTHETVAGVAVPPA